MYKIHATYNGIDPIPNEVDLHTIFEMMRDSPEDAFLIVDEHGNAECELDIDELKKLLLLNMRVAQREFDFSVEYDRGIVRFHNLPEHLCGTYRVENYYGDAPRHSFEQWAE